MPFKCLLDNKIVDMFKLKGFINYKMKFDQIMKITLKRTGNIEDKGDFSSHNAFKRLFLGPRIDRFGAYSFWQVCLLVRLFVCWQKLFHWP